MLGHFYASDVYKFLNAQNIKEFMKIDIILEYTDTLEMHKNLNIMYIICVHVCVHAF